MAESPPGDGLGVPWDGEAPTARVRVRIAGEEYVLKGTLTPQRLHELAAELDRRLGEVTRKYPRLPLHQAAVLCALQLLEELQQLREENRELLDLFARPR